MHSMVQLAVRVPKGLIMQIDTVVHQRKAVESAAGNWNAVRLATRSNLAREALEIGLQFLTEHPTAEKRNTNVVQ